MDRQTATFAGLGLAAVGERGVRAAAGSAQAAWRSPLGWPARRLTAPAVDALVRLGRDEEPRLRSLTDGRVTEVAVGVVVDSGVVEHAVAELLRREVIEEIADQLVSDAAMGRLVDELTNRLLASDQLQRIVTHVARSPEVREALAAQSVGMADEVAGAVRSRADRADETAERVARRLLRRRSGIAPEPS